MIFKYEFSSKNVFCLFLFALTIGPPLKADVPPAASVKVENGADIYNFYFQKAPIAEITEDKENTSERKTEEPPNRFLPIVVTKSGEISKNVWAEGFSGRFGVGHVSAVGGGMMFGMAYRWSPRWSVEVGTLLNSFGQSDSLGSEAKLTEYFAGVNYTFLGLSKSRVADLLFSVASGALHGVRYTDNGTFISGGNYTTRMYIGPDVRVKLSQSVGLIYQIRFDDIFGDDPATSNLLFLDLKF